MAMVLTFNMVNVGGSPQNNGGVLVGEVAMTGWDSHQKQNYAFGPNFGFFNVFPANLNWQNDVDLIDGIMNDMDNKASLNANI